MRRSSVPALISAIALGLTVANASAQTRPKLPFTLSKETTVITSPLNADGTPDYIAALNEKHGKGVTPENNGFVVYLQIVGSGENFVVAGQRDALLRLVGAKTTPPDAVLFKSFETFTGLKDRDELSRTAAIDEFTGARRSLWKDGQHPQIAAYLQAQQPSLDKLLDATSKPRWWIPLISGDGHSPDAQLPSLAVFRNTAEALCVRSTIDASAGDFQGFMRDWIAAKKFARRLASGSTLIERLVGIGVDAMANDPLGASAGAGKFTEAQCVSLRTAYDALPSLLTVADGTEVCERWLLLDKFLLVATGKTDAILPVFSENPGKTDNDFVTKLFKSIDQKSLDWNITLKYVNATVDKMVADLNQPSVRNLHAASSSLDQFREQWLTDAKASPDRLAKRAGESQQAYSQRVAQGLMVYLLPRAERAEELQRRDQLESQMVRLLSAAAQIHAKTGKWPVTLNELAPTYVKQIPHDFYPVDTPGELQYTITPAGIRISSVGDNNRPFGVGIQLPN